MLCLELSKNVGRVGGWIDEECREVRVGPRDEFPHICLRLSLQWQSSIILHLSRELGSEHGPTACSKLAIPIPSSPPISASNSLPSVSAGINARLEPRLGIGLREFRSVLLLVEVLLRSLSGTMVAPDELKLDNQSDIRVSLSVCVLTSLLQRGIEALSEKGELLCTTGYIGEEG